MKRFCRLRKPKEPTEKVAVFTSQDQAPQLLAVPVRPMASSLTQKFDTDDDLRAGMSMLKGCQFFQFDRVLVGHSRYALVAN